jgi:hypothetical protein
VSVKRGIFLAPFDDLVDPRLLGELAQTGQVRRLRASGPLPFELVIETAPGADLDPWRDAGATWILTGFGRQPREAEVRHAIEAGPR